MGEIAWLAVVGSALVTAALVLALGPALGSLLFPPSHARFWPTFNLRPEPTEEARYLLSLLGPLLASAAIVASVRHGRPLRAGRAHVVLVRGAQLLVPALLVAAFVRQHHPYFDIQIKHPYFSWWAGAFAAAFAFALAAIARASARARVTALLRETSGVRIACSTAAVAYVVAWLLITVNTDGSIGNASYAVGGLLPWTADDAYAVLNGLTPLADYHSLYGSLFPYFGALPMLVLGPSLLVLTTFMATVSGLVLLAVFGVLRRVARNSVAALALFLPFVAIGFYTLIGSHSNPFSAANDFSWFPIRIAGPYLLAWLVVRRLDGAWPRRTWPIFALGGLAVLNNVEVGAAGLVATVAALAWVRAPASRRELGVQIVEALQGLAVAYALVAGVTLVRAGSLPHLGFLTEYSAFFVRGGLGMQPMPGFGFQYVLYATYAAGIVLATVRVVGGRRDPLTAMLVWSGVFGFGCAGYFVGESRYLHLIFLFSAWALALAMLLVAVLSGRASQRPSPAELAVLAAFGLAVCGLAQTPAPWTQIDRIASSTPQPLLLHTAAERFVASTARHGERVVILLPLGHRIARDLGLANVAPYANEDLVDTSEQLAVVVRALRAAHGTRFYCWNKCEFPGQQLERWGFKLADVDPPLAFFEFVNRAYATSR